MLAVGAEAGPRLDAQGPDIPFAPWTLLPPYEKARVTVSRHVCGIFLESLEISNKASMGLWSNRSYQKGACPTDSGSLRVPKAAFSIWRQHSARDSGSTLEPAKGVSTVSERNRYLVTAGCE